MEQYTVEAMLNLMLLLATIGLFVYIKWYFSALSSNVRNRLHSPEIILSTIVGFAVYFIISNKALPLESRYLFFGLTLLFQVTSCALLIRCIRRRKRMFPRSYLIFHEGNFIKRVLSQQKLTERDVCESLRLKGISDLSVIESIVLEPDGELTVVYKEDVQRAA